MKLVRKQFNSVVGAAVFVVLMLRQYHVFFQVNQGNRTPNENGTRDPTPILQSTTQKVHNTVLESYDPRRFPVYHNASPTEFLHKLQTSPLRVAIITTHPLRGEALHFLYDGVVRSKHLHLVGLVFLHDGDIQSKPLRNANDAIQKHNLTLPDEDVDLWLVDGQRVAKFTNHSFWNYLSRSTKTSSNPSKFFHPHVLLVDFADRFSLQRRRYGEIGLWNLFNSQYNTNQVSDHDHYLRMAVRSIVEGRAYNSQEREIRPEGTISPNPFRLLHIPYAVRSDIVTTLVQELFDNTKADEMKTIDDPQSLQRLEQAVLDSPRPLDVYHPWKITKKGGQSRLRNDVSRLVVSWNHNTLSSVNGTIVLNTSTAESGPRMQQGRNAVDRRYVRALLGSKIVIVTQRDSWEDHYRLFEAMVCAPLVISDSMIAPPTGLEHSQNIVFFNNRSHLQDLVSFYVGHNAERQRIAKAGWNIAMTRHRSWHRLEEILFGMPLSL